MKPADVAKRVYQRYRNHYGSHLQGCCLVIADEIQRAVGGDVVAGYLAWNGGTCRRTHWWVVKDGQILDPVGDDLLSYEKYPEPGRVELHRSRAVFEQLLPNYEKWRVPEAPSAHEK